LIILLLLVLVLLAGEALLDVFTDRPSLEGG
jgi:hypothetical protein